MNEIKNTITPRFTVTHRVLHWTIALLMLILFLTGFLRMYWMSKKSIINAVEQNTAGITLDKTQLTDIARNIIRPMWQWHEYAAYVIAFLFVMRVLYMILKGIRFPAPLGKNSPPKERLQGITYIIFYIFLFISVVTGFYLKWGGNSLKELMETIHKWAIYWFPIFILLHFVGIWIAEITDKKGIVSRIIGGDETSC